MYKHFDAQRLFFSLNRQSAFWFIKEQMRISQYQRQRAQDLVFYTENMKQIYKDGMYKI